MIPIFVLALCETLNGMLKGQKLRSKNEMRLQHLCDFAIAKHGAACTLNVETDKEGNLARKVHHSPPTQKKTAIYNRCWAGGGRGGGALLCCYCVYNCFCVSLSSEAKNARNWTNPVRFTGPTGGAVRTAGHHRSCLSSTSTLAGVQWNSVGDWNNFESWQ